MIRPLKPVENCMENFRKIAPDFLMMQNENPRIFSYGYLFLFSFLKF